jgi:hypothetical protein
MSTSRHWDPNAPADHALMGIFITNLLAIGIALFTGGGLAALLWPYWVQSVVIGYYARRRMMLLERFSTDGVVVNNSPVAATPATARRMGNFFALHYGAFHAGYIVFLMAMSADERFGGGSTNLFWMALIAIGFVVSHGTSHREHVEADLRGTPNIGLLIALPYVRIIPMHITIIVGMMLSSGTGLLLFGGLKTLADLVMHKVEHRVLQGGTNEKRAI